MTETDSNGGEENKLKNALNSFIRWIKTGDILVISFKGILIFLAVNFLILGLLFNVTTGFHVIHEYEKGVVFRLGKYRATENAGLHFIIPIIDEVKVIETWERVVDIPQQRVVTTDLVTLMVDGVLRYRVTDPKTAIINIDNFNFASVEMSLTTIKEAVGEIEYEQLVSKRSEINQKVMDIVSENAKEWGIQIEGIEMKRMVPVDSKIQEALTQRAIAAQEKKAKEIMSATEKDIANNYVLAADTLKKGGDLAFKLRYLHSFEKFAKVKGGSFLFPLNLSGAEIDKMIEDFNE